MMEIEKPQLRPGYVEPYEGESISHYLGRWRREEANSVSSASGLGRMAGIGSVTARWEKFYLNPFPSRQELEAVGKLIGLDADKLAQMLPPKGVGMKHKPIRLCGACYGELPCHRIEWQFKDAYKCERHPLRLLTKCTNCETLFQIPALWVQGECSHCFLPFATMARRQKRC